MAVLPPKGKLVDRRPSMKGVMMQDVSQGAERSRVWPRSRGKITNQTTLEQMEWFRQAQWATKYMAPAQLVAFAEATKGTPLLPRDLATMMFAGRMMNFNMEDGRKINSMPTVAGVSDSLDVFTQTYGKTLMRGEQLWEAIDPIVANRVGVTVTRAAIYDYVTVGAIEAIPFTAETIDQALFWNIAAPSNIVIPFAGWYTCYFQTQRLANSGSIFSMIWQVNGVTVASHQQQVRDAGAGIQQAFCAPLFLQPFDVLRACVSDTNAAARFQSTLVSVVGNS